MIVPVIVCRDRPSMPRRWSSHTTYSSAVRRGSVAARHTPRSVAPSHAAKTVLVLLALIASSMGDPQRRPSRPRDAIIGASAPRARDPSWPSTRRRAAGGEDVAGRDAAQRPGALEQQHAVLVEIGEAAEDLAVAKPHAKGRAARVGAREPGAAQRGKALASPSLVPREEPGGERVGHRRRRD